MLPGVRIHTLAAPEGEYPTEVMLRLPALRDEGAASYVCQLPSNLCVALLCAPPQACHHGSRVDLPPPRGLVGHNRVDRRRRDVARVDKPLPLGILRHVTQPGPSEIVGEWYSEVHGSLACGFGGLHAVGRVFGAECTAPVGTPGCPEGCLSVEPSCASPSS